MKAKTNNRHRGQTASEYMLVLSVVVISVVGAAYAFVPTFQTGVNELGFDVSKILAENGSARGGFGVAGGSLANGGVNPTSGQAESNGTVENYDPNSGMGDAISVSGQ